MSDTDNNLLGTKAENLLDLKCNEVGLITIDPKPDIEGIDRRIVWVRPGSMVLAEGESYDTAKPYRSASIQVKGCLLYTSPSPRDLSTSRMPSSA